MRHKCIVFVILFILFQISSLCAYNIKNLTYKDGLSNSSILYIFQDSKQRMWFGTWDGLNMYNSFEFKKWKAGLHNPHSFTSNIIYQISEDSQGVFWVCTEYNINRFDEKTDISEKYPLPNAKLTINASDHIIASSSDQAGLFYYNAKSNLFERIKHPEAEQMVVRELFFANQALWIQTENDDLQQITYRVNEEGEFIIEKVRKIFPDHTIFTLSCQQDEIWLIDKNGWIIHYDDLNRQQIKFFNILPDLDFNSREFQDDTHLVIDAKNQFIYVNSKLGGIRKLGYQKNQIVSEEEVLTDYKISIMALGSQDVLWVGTDGQGIFMLSPLLYNFYNYDNTQYGNTEQSVIRAFSKDVEGTLWIGTKGSGIYCVPSFNTDRTIDHVQHFHTENGLLHNMVYELYEDKDGDIVIGTDGRGINIYNVREKRMHSILWNHPAINDEEFKYIYSIYQDADSIYWLGTNRSGLIRMEIEKRRDSYKVLSYKRYSNKNLLSNNNVIAIVPENDSILWIGTKGGGINRLNTKDEICEYLFFDENDPSSLSNDNVLCMYRDSENIFWVGTFVGLNKAIQTENGKYKFQYYTESQGLLDNTVKAITEDNMNNLWLSTSSGINKLDKDKNTILFYDYRNGVLENEFAENAAFSHRKFNQLFFGGTNGFTCFFAEDIHPYNYQGSILLTEFKIQNENVNLYDYMGQEGVLDLKHNQNFFSLNYHAIDYVQGDLKTYLYKLENFNADWIDNGHSHMCNFTNVPPGDYILRIKCENKYSNAPEVEYSLPIHISKPWWIHPVALVTYFLVVVLICFIIFRVYIMRMNEKNALIIEKMNRKKEEDIHESKLRFFTNIAHELSTPLTLINGRCEKILAMNKVDSTLERYVGIIHSNAIRMNSLIKQIMEFRKIETGNQKIHVENIEVVDLVKSILNDFQELIAENKNLLKVDFEPDAFHFTTDKDSLTKILYNLISNAVKYTPAFGSISIVVRKTGDDLYLQITNTGQGIKKEDLQYLFNRFRILDNYEKDLMKSLPNRNGIGLSLCHSLVTLLKGQIEVESEYGESTTFRVVLPALPIDEKANETANTFTIKGDDYFEAVIKSDLITESNEATFSPATKTDKNRPSVLVVDDNEEILSLIYDSLKEKYNFSFASNGVEALELIKINAPDLVILDIMMPGMDGYELTKAIKSNKIISHVLVVILSSKITVEDQIDGLSSGADAYLSKPFNMKHLEILVDRLLENKFKLQTYFNSPINQVDYLDGKVMDKDAKEFLEKLNEIIEENLDNEELNPDFLSMKLFISRIQLYRKLKNLTGKSPSEYIRNIRFRHCSKLLVTTNMTVQEIMFRSGFTNKGSFFKEFTKIYNCSPKQYREKNTKDVIPEN